MASAPVFPQVRLLFSWLLSLLLLLLAQYHTFAKSMMNLWKGVMGGVLLCFVFLLCVISVSNEELNS